MTTRINKSIRLLQDDKRVFNHKRYDDLVNETVKNLKQLAELKGGEYAGDQDRLANFRHNAETNEVPYEVIWNVYCSKHWDAIQQYIRDQSIGLERKRMESLLSRCDDIIVYMTLFKAMIIEAEELAMKDIGGINEDE